MKKVLLTCMIALSILTIGCGVKNNETSKKDDTKKAEDMKKDKEEESNVLVLVGKSYGVEMFENSNPTITLQKNEKRFSFTLSPLSSYMPMGMYEITDDELILNVDNDSNNKKYVFKIKGDEYIFDAKNSAEVPEIKMTANGKPQEVVPDGMVFTAVN